MVKRTRSRKKNPAKKINPPAQPRRTKVRARAAMRAGLDSAAAAYAQLLLDPCQAPLTHPVYSGGDGGYLGRYETDVLVNAATGIGAVLFVPGAMGISAAGTVSSAGNNSVMYLGDNTSAAELASDTTAGKWCVLGSPSVTQPGYASLYAASAAVRPVAACVQLYYTGSELDRKGIVSMTRVNAGSVLGESGNGPTVAQYRSISNLVVRTPADHTEMKWTPGDGDQLYTDPTLITTLREVERKNAILITYSGLPVNTSGAVRLRFVVVYEWTPGAIGGGLMTNMSSRARSVNTLDHVLNALDRLGNWWTSTGNSATRVAFGMYKAYQNLTDGRQFSRLTM